MFLEYTSVIDALLLLDILAVNVVIYKVLRDSFWED